MERYELLTELRERVAIKSRVKDTTPEDCKIISQLIFHQTKNYLSESTLKRFFGFLESCQPPSPFVLNSLAQFIGFARWADFRMHLESGADDSIDKD